MPSEVDRAKVPEAHGINKLAYCLMTDPPTPTSTDSGFTIPSETFKTVGWFAVRLTLSLVIVTTLMFFLGEPLHHLIARAGRNLLAMVSSQYYLMTIEYIDDGGFGVTTWFGPLRGGFKLPSLFFSFAFPLAYSLAIPGVFTLRYWLRNLAVILIGFFVCAISLAFVSDVRLTSLFLQFGISLQPDWRIDFSHYVSTNLWMYTTRFYPLMAIIILALESGQFRPSPRSEPSKSVRVLHFAVLGVLVVLLALTIGFDSVANKRIEVVKNEPVARRFNDIAQYNPTLEVGLVKLGEYLENEQNFEGAHNAYRLAVTKLKGRPRKLARRARDRVHERIKADLLEGSQERLRIQFGFPPRE